MPALLAPAIALAVLLAGAGAAKVVDPVMTVGALRALHLPASPTLVRLGAGAEVVLAMAALTVRGPVPYLLVAVSMLGFAGFVLIALRRGTLIGSCGCFGREDTPPHWLHLALNVVLAAVGAAAATFPEAPVVLVADHPAEGGALVLCALVLAGLLYAAFVDLPRLLTEVQAATVARESSR